MVTRWTRYRQIAGVLIKYGFGIAVEGYAPFLIRNRFFREKKAEAAPMYRRMRLALEELGPTFIKLGQIMSTRREILPPGLIEELNLLTDRCTPLPFAEIRPVIEEVTGPIGEVFSSVDEEPLAAASLAQVHRAVLKDGTVVALKVQRPGIADIIETDLGILRSMARGIEARFPDLAVYNPTGLVREFSVQIRKELDFVRDGKNADLLRQNMRELPRIRVPRIYWEYSGPTLLAMEYIEGVRIDDVAGIRRIGANPRQIAELTLKAYLTQIFGDGFFHGDPHPGNLIVTPGKELAYLDFGIMGVIRPERRFAFIDLLFGIVENDVNLLIDSYRALGVEISEEEAEGFKDETYAVFHQYRTYEARHFDISQMLAESANILRSYHLRVPTTMMLMFKVLMMMSDHGERLDPEFNFVRRVSPYLDEIAESRYFSEEMLRRGLQSAVEVGEDLTAIPHSVNRALERIAGGGFSVELHDSDITRMRHSMRESASIVLIGMVVASLVVGTSIVVLALQPQLAPGMCMGFWNLTLLGYLAAVGVAVYALYYAVRKK
jgi:ubiquinone biosynthesis protein